MLRPRLHSVPIKDSGAVYGAKKTNPPIEADKDRFKLSRVPELRVGTFGVEGGAVEIRSDPAPLLPPSGNHEGNVNLFA